ncbi:helix-turn-helix domain-containing protein [Pseudooceanicola sp. MF1-13]|uniref:helix-turn-helix domain-containing protein n=1 Tax=Pseudooceanicola sp. MF1-13 TaxID=3379095 RepID=UPI003891A85F
MTKTFRESAATWPVLVDRKMLMQRWRCGSDATFWRHAKTGKLRAVTDGRHVRYAREDVYAFEGGQPPAGMEDAYAADLITAAEAARHCSVKRSTIVNAARSGSLSTRRIGKTYRFVFAEVEAWQKRRFVNRKSLKNSRNTESE